MAKTVNRLSAREVMSLGPGKHADGGNLYLFVSKDLTRRRWIFLFRWKEPGEPGTGKLREMGLGAPPAVGLKEAREAARKADAVRRQGRNPLDARKLVDRIPTFGEVADETVAALGSGWRNEKHRAQWKMTLTRYAESIRNLPVNTITVQHVLQVLQPIWLVIPETASRLRGRIEAVLDAAKVRGHRVGENPARWRGNLAHLLPKPEVLSRGHHAALPYNQVPAFVKSLRSSNSISALCLEFTILTAARSGEAMGAVWSEFDLERAVWTIPAGRMKAKKEHRVPLARRALEIAVYMHESRINGYVFPGQGRGQAKTTEERPLSVMALEMVMRRMKVEATVHGFRSAFRDWAAEMTSVPGAVAEACLAHVNKDRVEAAYRRTDFFDLRRDLMAAWGNHCEAAGKQTALEASVGQIMSVAERAD